MTMNLDDLQWMNMDGGNPDMHTTSLTDPVLETPNSLTKLLLKMEIS